MDTFNSIKKEKTLLEKINKNKINILFKGRFEKIKGCYQFINGIGYLEERDKKKINVIMIGTGTEEKKILELIKKKNWREYFFSH